MIRAAALLLLAAGCAGETTTAPRVPRHLRHGVLQDLVLYVRPAAAGGPFLLDRFETTRRDWSEYLAQSSAVPSDAQLPLLTNVGRGEGTLPMARVTLAEARAFAAWRWARLPRRDEWEFAAGGGGRPRYRFPWGDRSNPGAANTGDLGLGRAMPAGVFESGRSGEACYDLIGNVAEWTESVPAWFHSAFPLGWRIGGPYQGLVDSWERLPPSLRVWRSAGVWLGGIHAAAVLHAELPREVVGGHFGVLVFEGAADGSSALVVEMLPAEWSDRVGLRVATTPDELLEALVQQDAAAAPELRGELRQMLQRESYLNLFREAWVELRESVRTSNATVAFLASLLLP